MYSIGNIVDNILTTWYGDIVTILIGVTSS